jgi:carbonic anhydrase/acetyltransferase-like protein (isoleucine patch superfamily)
VPPKSLIFGSPARIRRPATVKELAWISESAENYVRYARQYLSGPNKPAPGFRS